MADAGLEGEEEGKEDGEGDKEGEEGEDARQCHDLLHMMENVAL